MRGEKVSRADELLTFFRQARQPKEQVAALDQIIRFHNEFDEPGEAVAADREHDRGQRGAKSAAESGAYFRTGDRARRFADARVRNCKNDKPGSDSEPFDRGGRDATGDDSAETSVRQRAAGVAGAAGGAGAAMDGSWVCN